MTNRNNDEFPEVAELPSLPVEHRDKEPDLPPAVIEVSKNPVDKQRLCPKCGKEGRVVSNSTGRFVICGPCKHDWPISMSVGRVVNEASLQRGLSKQTIIEPDFSTIFEPDEEDVPHETRQWRKPDDPA